MVVARREQSEIANLYVCLNSRETRGEMMTSPRIEWMVDGRGTRPVPDAAPDGDRARQGARGRRGRGMMVLRIEVPAGAAVVL